MTLEKSKTYGLEQAQESLHEKARTKLSTTIPHQAPQRERVSASLSPRRGKKQSRRPWKDLIRPEINMGVPTLMMILEPNITWDRSRGFVKGVGKDVEAAYANGAFFEGWYKKDRWANGVYEGSYWELLADCHDLITALSSLSRAPPLIPKPVLNLPQQPPQPKWEDFRPKQHPMPPPPEEPELKLPPFQSPHADRQITFQEPTLIPVPFVQENPKEDIVAAFTPPEPFKVDPFIEPEFVDLEPPHIPDPPKPPKKAAPQFGFDWTGSKPHLLDEPEYVEPVLLHEREWRHPPRRLPPLPKMLSVRMASKRYDFTTRVSVQLVWEEPVTVPEELPVIESPKEPSKEPTREPTPEPPEPPRPEPPPPPPEEPEPEPVLPEEPPPPPPPEESVPPTPPSPVFPASPLPSPREPSVLPSPAVSTPEPESVMPTPPKSPSPLPSPPRKLPKPPSPPKQPSPKRPLILPGSQSFGMYTHHTLLDDLNSQLDMVPEEDSPRYELDIEPSGEVPRLILPPKPDLDPEPQWDDFKPKDSKILPLPPFVPPKENVLPPFKAPPAVLPYWCPPSEPRPIGLLRGVAPVILVDVSGSTNPHQRGKFKEIKEVLSRLLDEYGEVATAALAFDVILFSSAAWSWSDNHDSRTKLIASGRTMYSGRHAGLRVAGLKPVTENKPQRMLKPADPDLVVDARNWVTKWPEATGGTSFMSAIAMADQIKSADCWYFLSDGLAGDMPQVEELLKGRLQRGETVPFIHSIGFLPEDLEDGPGERFLKRLAKLTGGTFQSHQPKKMRVYQEGIGFVDQDMQSESQAQREERFWAEEMVRAERRKNVMEGTKESYDTTVLRIKGMHHEHRVVPALQRHQQEVERLKSLYDVEHALNLIANKDVRDTALREWKQKTGAIRERNDLVLAQATEDFEWAQGRWQAVQDEALHAWEERCNELKRRHRESVEVVVNRELEAQRLVAQAQDVEEERAKRKAARAKLMLGMPTRPSSAAVEKRRPWSGLSQGTAFLMRNLSNHDVSADGRPARAPHAPSLPGIGYDSRASKPMTPESVDSRTGQKLTPRTLDERRKFRDATLLFTRSRRASYSEDSQAYTADVSDTLSRLGSTMSATIQTPGSSKMDQGLHSEDLSRRTTQLEEPSSQAVQNMLEDLSESGVIQRKLLTDPNATALLAHVLVKLAAAVSEQPSEEPSPIVIHNTVVEVVSTAELQNALEAVESPALLRRTISDLASAPAALQKSLSGIKASPKLHRSLTTVPSPLAGGKSPERLNPNSPLKLPRIQSLKPVGEEALPITNLAAASPAGHQAASVSKRISETDSADGSSMPTQEVSYISQEPSWVEQGVTPEGEVGEEEGEGQHGVLVRNDSELRRAEEDEEQRGRLKKKEEQRFLTSLVKYEEEVIAIYASSLTDAIMKSARAVVSNEVMVEQAVEEWNSKVDDVNAMNARIINMHMDEVTRKAQREEEYAQTLKEYEEKKLAIMTAYEEACVAARKAHKEAVPIARAKWEARKQLIENMNEESLRKAKGLYEKRMLEAAENNIKFRQEHAELVRIRDEIVAANEEKLDAAHAQYRRDMEVLAETSEMTMAEALERHQALCKRLAEQHEASQKHAREQYQHLKELLQTLMKGESDDARQRYHKALASHKETYETKCANLKTMYEAELEMVNKHNGEIWNQVQVSRVAQAELKRVQAFAEHIRTCANKFEIGVNLMPDTPNYDRVVEMQALMDGLSKAFAEAAKDFPWPEFEQKLEQPGGWTPSLHPWSPKRLEPLPEANANAAAKIQALAEAESPLSRSLERIAEEERKRTHRKFDSVVGGAAANIPPVTIGRSLHAPDADSPVGRMLVNALQSAGNLQQPSNFARAAAAAAAAAQFPMPVGSPSPTARARLTTSSAAPLLCSPHRMARLSMGVPFMAMAGQPRAASTARAPMAFVKDTLRQKHTDMSVKVSTSAEY